MIPMLQGFLSQTVVHPARWVRFGQYVTRERVGRHGYRLVDRSERLNYERSVRGQGGLAYQPPLTQSQYEKLLKKAR